VKQGAVIIGAKPSVVAVRKIHPDMPGDIKSLPDKLWALFDPGELKRRAAKIYFGVEPSVVLDHLGIVPDISYAGNEFFTLDYIHYAKEDIDFYFVRNTTGEWLSRDVRFRQQNKVPEVWDPVSGSIVPV